MIAWTKNPAVTVIETMAYPVEKVKYPSVTMCPFNPNSDRWGTPVKIMDFVKRSCETDEGLDGYNCTQTQMIFRNLSAEVDKVTYKAAKDMLQR